MRKVSEYCTPIFLFFCFFFVFVFFKKEEGREEFWVGLVLGGVCFEWDGYMRYRMGMG